MVLSAPAILMEFDGMGIDSRLLDIGTIFYWLIADLNAHKNTVKILSDFNKCYPIGTDEWDRQVHEALEKDNEAIAHLQDQSSPLWGI